MKRRGKVGSREIARYAGSESGVNAQYAPELRKRAYSLPTPDSRLKATSRRFGFKFQLLFLTALFLFPAFATAAALFQGEWSIESSDAAGLTLRWQNARPFQSGADKPRSLAVAVPPGTAADAALLSASSATGPLTLSAPSRYRDAFVAALNFNPRGSAGAAVAAATARIRVSFHATANAAPFRAAFAPSEDSPAERLLKGWVINYAQSRGYRSMRVTPAGLAKTAAAADAPSASAGLPKQRLILKTQGENIEVVNYDDLYKAGAPLKSINPRFMHLWFDGREVPMYVEGEGDGRFDVGDYIEFIGKRAAGTTSWNSFYTNTATFILTWDGGSMGLRAPAVPVASRTGGIVPEFPADAKVAPPFRAFEHVEEDNEVLRIGSTSAEEIIDLGSRVQETELTDFWFWQRLGTEKDVAEIPFAVGETPSAPAKGGGDAGGILRVTINLKGVTNNPKADPDHHLKFILNGSDISLVGGVQNDAIWEGQDSYTWISAPLSPSVLQPGQNVLTIQKVNDLKTSDGQLVDVQDAYLNYIELTFPSGYNVVKDKLTFSNAFADSVGRQLFTLTGFSGSGVSLWDKQGRKLVNYRMTQAGSTWSLSFLDSLVGRTDYVAAGLDQREVPKLQMDTLDDLIGTSQGADYLVITQKQLFGKALDSLIEYRKGQGLRTRVVRADHIYQAFGDGSLDPAAIRRFVAYAYQNWARPAPTYLALIGDAAQGFDKHGETIIPFHPVNIRGWGVAANDDFFAKVSGDDDIADLFVGRIPANNTAELSAVVHKTLALETDRPQGHWSNQQLLISGFESGFTDQNYVLQGIAAANDRQVSRLDLFPGSPYYKSAAQRTNFFDQLDSGFTLVSFVGHGGGAVWSDAGVLTLQALDDGKLQGDFPIPFVSSVTCLTGFFEDATARSLGEEMVRTPKGGAAAFYGAAGYISSAAGAALSSEILKAVSGNGATTSGAAVGQAETMVKLETGDAFLPILAEFNLLGDPALRISFPDHEGALALQPQALSGALTLKANASKLPFDGDAVASVLLGDSTESVQTAKASGGSLSVQGTFAADPGAVQNGKVIVNYWNDKQARVVSAPFSTLDWLIDSVSIDPAAAAPGDSVRIRLHLNTAYAKTAFVAGVASYAVGTDQAPLFPGDNQNGLKADDASHLSTVSKVRLDVPAADIAGPRVYLAFRLTVQALDDQGNPTRTIPNMSSRIYSLPLLELPRLELPLLAFHLPAQYKPGVWVTVHNRGLGAASAFHVSLSQDVESATPQTDVLPYPRQLAFGGLDSIFFPLNETTLNGKRIRAVVIGAKDGDVAQSGGSQDTVFHFLTRGFNTTGDSLALDSSGVFLSMFSGTANQRAYVEKVSVTSLPSHLSPSFGSLPITAYRILDAALPDRDLIIGKLPPAAPKTGSTSSSAGAASSAKTAAAPTAHWHFQDPKTGTWLKLDTLAGSPNSAVLYREGVYALLVNSDAAPPQIQLSSRGQTLLPDDYVPLHTPIDVVIRDGQGVDLSLHPPALKSASQSFDTSNSASDKSNPFPTLARFSFLPAHNASVDSLTVTARDISGNVSTRTLVYRMGQSLSIQDLGSYPNPFADTATFVYSLTDYCDKVELRIYSRAGRPVRTLEQRNVVGYQEVTWDGKSSGGGNVANGLYFLKVTASSGGKETSRTFKLFKKQRK